MTRGKTVQVGSADALFERACTPSWALHWLAGHELPASAQRGRQPHGGRQPPGQPVGRTLPAGALQVGPPEYLALAQLQQAGALPGTVVQVQDIGTYQMLTAKVGEHTVKARFTPPRRAAIGR